MIAPVDRTVLRLLARLLLRLPPGMLFFLLLALAVLSAVAGVPVDTKLPPLLGGAMFAAVLLSAVAFGVLSMAWGRSRPGI